MEGMVVVNPCRPHCWAGAAGSQRVGSFHQSSYFGGRSMLLRSCGSNVNVENVRRAAVSVRAKGKRSFTPGRQPNKQQMPAMPKMDEGDDTPKFVLFIRTKNVPRWYPLSVVTGGTTAKVMVAAMKNEWGRKLYGGTLTRNIAGVIYKDERSVRQAAIKQYPVLKAATGFEYGYKIMDSKNPKSALYASDVVQIPPQAELKSVVDKVKDFFGNTVGSIKESFGSISSLSTGSQEQTDNPADSKDKK